MGAKESKTSRQLFARECALGFLFKEQQRKNLAKNRVVAPLRQTQKRPREVPGSWLGHMLMFVGALAALSVLNGCAGLVSSANTTSSPPVALDITNVQATPTTTSTSQINWTTNVPANSVVDYGTTTSYGTRTPVDSTMVTNHQVTLSGLAAGTIYYYQVSSTDTKNNNAHKGGNPFKTTGYSISGAISPLAGGSGSTLTLTGATSATTTTDSSGNYAFTALPTGTYGITPSNAGYTFTPSIQNVTVYGGNIAGVNFTANAVAGPMITTQPVNQTVAAGQTATFMVVATGTAPLSYKWQKNGTSILGANSSTYTTPTTSSSDNGAQFTVVVNNTVGSVTSTAATLTVNAAPQAPSITTQPASQTVTAGQTATFSVAATGTAPLAYQWNKNGVVISGAASSSYSTPATTSSDNGAQFTVVVNNTAGSVTSSAATLTVNAAAVAPSITTQPTNQTVTAGQVATFSVAASGSAPLSYQWQKNGVNIAGATSTSYTTPATTTADSGTTFRVLVNNSAGSATSSAATLTVNAAVQAPSITTQPASQTVTAGQTASFSVTAAGTAPLGYQWQKNGTNITGATSSSYTTPATTTSDSGSTFRVLVSNTAGTVTSAAATLTVNAAAVPPSIITQPASLTVTAGQTASFSVATTGTAPLSYQWQKNGVAIGGATSSSYTTPATTSSDNGAQFTVAVSNAAGSVTSNTATLTVNAAVVAPSIATQPVNQTVTTGQTASFSVTATGTAPLSYQWLKNSVAISGAISSSYTTPATTSSDNGAHFTVTVSNSAGSATSSAAMLTVQPSAAFPVWVSPGLLRVGQTDAPGTTSSINLFSARGETVDSQVIVQGPSGGLTSVNLSASALTGPSGAIIPASNITLYREYYIAVTGTASYGGGSNPPLGSGTYPEPLIPFLDPETGAALCSTSAALKACNASVSAGQNQPYWIDISVPHGATNSPTGIYTGTISITTAQGNATIPVSLTVWNFELPMQPSELSLWTLWPANSGNTTTSLAQALMRNKVMGWYDVAGNASFDISNMGLNRTGLDSYYYIGIQCNGSYSSLPSTSQINSAAANFPSGLPLDFYVADELNGCTGDYGPIRTLAANAHAANPSVKLGITLNATDANLYGSIDHWILLDSMQQWPALPFSNGELWSYTSCNAGYGNTPEWMVDYPPINERIQAGFLDWTQGATGILYYRADGWTNGNTIASWNNVDTTACGGGLGRPGDGIFLYPPGPIASSESAPGIRLKAIRDGIQDYEYAHTLNSLGQLSLLNSAVAPIATSWTSWTHDPNALENARQQLGQLLHQLAP
ncbi:MAG TPA: immunoglobulin domain-containing protein [Candidatus Acidoferrum sp.]|nr:immunoglobulin domain-containing protein [Candidatus Acidoferrum sp.]